MALIVFQSTHPARGATRWCWLFWWRSAYISIHAPREGCDWWWKMVCSYRCHFNPRTPRGVRPRGNGNASKRTTNFNPRTPRGVRRRTTFPTSRSPAISIHAPREGCDSKIRRFNIINKNFNPRTPRGVRLRTTMLCTGANHFNPRTPRGVRQQTLLKSREFAWLNLLICTRGRRLSIQKQTRLCSIKLSFMLFGCEPAGEGVSSWTSHATKSKVRLEGRSAYSQSVRSSAHSDFPGNKSGGCPVRDP